jgi:bacterioferritin
VYQPGPGHPHAGGEVALARRRAELERILVSEEDHANWIEAQLSLIAQAGEANYLAQQIRDGD